MQKENELYEIIGKLYAHALFLQKELDRAKGEAERLAFEKEQILSLLKDAKDK